MEGYKVSLIAGEGLTAKQMVAIKNFDHAYRLDEETAGGKTVIMKPVAWAHLKIENDYSKNDKEYEKYLFIADDGKVFVTGSVPCRDSFANIWEDKALLDESGEEWAVEFYAEQSKNQPGEFISCRII